jgi:hypothetical protein
MDPKADFAAILTTLNDQQVDYLVVGMLAAVLQGATAVTIDVDIVHRRSPENVAKLLAALQNLDAVYRTDRRGLRPNESHLAGPGHHLLRTRLGDLDVLGSLAEGADFDALSGDTVEVDIEGVRVRVLELSRLIEVKQAAGRPKDLAVLPLLRATLDEIRKRRA